MFYHYTVRVCKDLKDFKGLRESMRAFNFVYIDKILFLTPEKSLVYLMIFRSVSFQKINVK